jgi:Icc-related predicted phosphoesterase
MSTENWGRTETDDGANADDAASALCALAGARTLAHFARPRATTETTLAVISDPHVSTEKAGTWKAYHRTEARFEAALADADARGVDGVVLAGDLTENGRPADVERVAELLGALDAPFVAVPGNHDVPKAFKNHETPPVSAFESRFTPGGLPFRARLGGVDVLGLDSATAPDGALESTHDGAISADQREWLDGALADAEAPLVVSHHNLPGLDVEVGADGYAPHPPVGDAAALADVLTDRDALHVSGHVHLPAAMPGDLRGLICPPLSSFPQAYVLATVGPEGTTVRQVPVADEAGVAEARELARTHSARSADVCEMVESQLAALPLVDER